ncbi:Crp/Fnr family transcriptional regulator [Methyloraptor flagellatus]|uniref:Crp/Fnr family transcriptional regulator n=1 Tax=Methyloraptor flagellatus TaxID=3162530 RepID=A0AAU7XF35_9HYPH
MALLDRSLLADMPLFAGLGPAALDDIIAEARSARVAKGATVFEQDADATSFFVLLHGHLQVLRITPAGAQVIVRYVVPGELFGIAVQMGRATYPATALAVVDSVALSWSSIAWPRMMERFPSLAVGMMRTLGQRIDDAHGRVVEMSTEEVERRVAHAILRLVKQAGRRGDRGITIDFPISRQDVAEMTGTTLHTVSRILSGWETRGLVEGGRQKITVCDPHRLFLLAENRAE